MMENLTNSDVILLLSLIGLIIVVGIICIVLTIKGGKKTNSKKEKDTTKMSEPDIHIALATSNIPDVDNTTYDLIDEEEVIINKPVYNEENFDILDDEMIKDEVIIESNTPDFKDIITEEVLFSSNKVKEDEEDMRTSANIEEVLKAMEGDLEKQKYEKIDRYEEEQEENAVISYQELLKRKMALANEEVIKEEKIETASSNYLDELNSFKDIVLEPIPDKDDERPFVNSEFVSPIFGRVNNTVNYPTVKKTTTVETLKTETPIELIDELKENDEFLNTLKEFRRNL